MRGVTERRPHVPDAVRRDRRVLAGVTSLKSAGDDGLTATTRATYDGAPSSR